MRLKIAWIGLILLGLILGSFMNSGITFAGNIDNAEPENDISGARGSRVINQDSEPNNDFASASLLDVSPGSPPVVMTGTFNNAGDVDFFKLYYTKGDPGGIYPSKVFGNLDGTNLNSNFAYFEIYDPSLHLIARTANTPPIAVFKEFFALNDGYYYFVIRQTAFGSGSYDFTFSNESAENDLDDSNNNFADAMYIPDITTQQSSNKSYIHEFNDTYDFWEFDVIGSMAIKINLTMDNNIDCDLYAHANTVSQTSGVSATTGFGRSEEVNVIAFASGKYYVRVQLRHWPNIVPGVGNYTLKVYGSIPPQVNKSMSNNIYLDEDSGVFHKGIDGYFLNFNLQPLVYEIWNNSLGDWVNSLETSNMSISVSLNNSLQVNLKPNMFGVDQVIINATDVNGHSGYRTVNITVFEVNDPPKLDATSSWPISGGTGSTGPDRVTGTQNSLLKVNVTAVDVDILNPSPYTDSLTYKATFHDKGTTKLNALPFTVDPLSGSFEFIPSNDAAGKFTVNISVTDNPLNQNNQTDWRLVEFVINDLNDKPELNKITDLYVNEDSLLNYTITAMDIDAVDTLTFETNFTADMVSGEFSFGPDGKISFLPDNNDVGWHYLNITVKDKGNLKDYMDIRIKVNNTNDAPVAIISSPKEGVFIEAEMDLVTLDASSSYDDDLKHGNEKLTYNWRSNLESEIGKIKTTSIFLVKEGVHTITLTVTDLAGESSTAIVNVTVMKDVPPPVENVSTPTLNLTEPADGQMINVNATILKWDTNFEYDSVLKYNVYLWDATGSRGSPIAEKISDRYLQVWDLKDKTTYKWEVIPWYFELEGKCFNGPFSFEIDFTFVPTYGVDLTFDGEIKIKTNETKTFEFSIHNKGNTLDTYDLFIESGDTKLEASFDNGGTTIPVTVFSSGSKKVSFTLTASKDLSPEDIEIKITGRSKNDLSKIDYLNLTAKVTAGTDVPKNGDNGDGGPGGKEGKSSNTWLYAVIIIVIMVIVVVMFLMIMKKKKPAEETPADAGLQPMMQPGYPGYPATPPDGSIPWQASPAFPGTQESTVPEGTQPASHMGPAPTAGISVDQAQAAVMPPTQAAEPPAAGPGSQAPQAQLPSQEPVQPASLPAAQAPAPTQEPVQAAVPAAAPAHSQTTDQTPAKVLTKSTEQDSEN